MRLLHRPFLLSYKATAKPNLNTLNYKPYTVNPKPLIAKAAVLVVCSQNRLSSPSEMSLMAVMVFLASSLLCLGFRAQALGLRLSSRVEGFGFSLSLGFRL